MFCILGRLGCTFDEQLSPFCEWTNDEAGDFKWRRNSGSTSPDTGPSGDKNTGTGSSFRNLNN